ncbi:MAG: hypothetical protein IKU03_04170 [Bacteroidales bacterium]|nr:hypothetical protein [Bacteroidales bacterium]
MKKLLIIVCLLTLSLGVASAQSSKQENRKNLTVKEWKRGNAGKGARYLDHVTKYDAQGRKIEEIEYNSSSKMVSRCTYTYNENGKVKQEVVYDERNKAIRIRKFEYNSDGTKHKQYNYSPDGKLISVKEFEYIR